jgi:hypothetical protein
MTEVYQPCVKCSEGPCPDPISPPCNKRINDIVYGPTGPCRDCLVGPCTDNDTCDKRSAYLQEIAGPDTPWYEEPAHISIKAWAEVKKMGSAHYKGDQVEPIDLYRDGGTLRHFAICSIIKYAWRNKNGEEPVSVKDMDKIIHYAEMLKSACGE